MDCRRVELLFLVSVPFLLAACGGAASQPAASVEGSANDPLIAEGQRYLLARDVSYDLARARELFEAACTRGSQRGCALLGDALTLGPIAETNFIRALELTSAACEAGDPLGCTHHAWIAQGDGLGDPEQHCAVHERVCAEGELMGCLHFGWCFEEREDLEQARHFYRRACDGGVALGCSYLGAFFEDGMGVERDITRALRLYLHACENGDPSGCASAGFVYEAGPDELQDVTRAVPLYRRACNSGEPRGCYFLALLYRDGRGVRPDPERALALHHKACDQGIGSSCVYLGMLYQAGDEVSRDLALATNMYERGCALGEAGACSALGLLYLDGVGVTRSPLRALELFRDACDGGSLVACAHAGRMLIRRQEVPYDPETALALYELACAGDVPESCRMRGSALSHMAWLAEEDTDPVARAQRILALNQRGCEMGHESACLHRDVLEGRVIPGAREWEVEILETENAPSWIRVGDVCTVTVLTGVRLARLRVSCGGRLIYPPTSVIPWTSTDRAADDETTRVNSDARLIIDGRAGTFLLEDDDAGFLPNLRLRGHVMPLHR